MQRDLSRLSSEIFDVLILGGGATGAFTARDAAMRGLKVALVEARDFAGATSAHNSRLAHGGLRYLRNLEIGLVRESLKERAALLHIAPHLVRPLPFLLPLYGRGRAKLAAGLTLYDLLALGGGLPRHRWIGRKAALARAPVLARDGFRGAFEYHDAQMYAPERIALECLIDAEAHGAAIANYLSAERLLLRSGKVEGCTVRDAMTAAAFDVRAKTILVAAGPWSDLFLAQALGRPAKHPLIRSKGIHLLVPPLTAGDALTMEAGDGHFFVLPWRGHTLLGTTDTPFTGDPGRLGVSAADVAGLLATVNRYLPAAKLTAADIQAFYAGLRPLVADGSKDTYGVSRRAELVDHGKEENAEGLFSALGGKWTTSRALAETAVDALVAKLGVKAPRCATARRRLPGGRFDSFDGLLRGMQKTYPGIPALTHLAHMFGMRLPQVLKGARVSELLPLGAGGDTLAQIRFAVREEMALTLEDVVMRRTTLGQFGRPDDAVLEQVAGAMAELLGWDADRKAREMARLDPLFTLQDDTAKGAA
jgi:glycerol-3-phosphate dehydrogenase